MLTKTSEAGIQTLVYLAVRDDDEPVSPRVIAEELGLSPSYLSKVAGQLVRANILSAHRGVKGGVTLNQPPSKIRLLDVVQALQGVIIGRYCDTPVTDPSKICAFHQAMQEIQDATIRVLSRWTLAMLAARPMLTGTSRQRSRCLMNCLRDVCDQGPQSTAAR